MRESEATDIMLNENRALGKVTVRGGYIRPDHWGNVAESITTTATEVRPPIGVPTAIKLNNVNRSSVMATAIKQGQFICCTDAYWKPKNAKTSMFAVLSLLYAKLLIVACVAFVVSQEITKRLPIQYYEGFFTYLYGGSILYLLYVFCFLLRESCCCGGEKNEGKVEKAPTENKASAAPNDGSTDVNQASKQRPVHFQDTGTLPKVKSVQSSGTVGGGCGEPSLESIDLGSSTTDLPVPFRKRKTTQDNYHGGSLFLRIAAIAFGLGTMIYSGLEFGRIFEIPFSSPCYQLLPSLNPILQMVFTFAQMYFIFTNSRLNIHRFKVISRFGLMHVMATNVCVWIRTVVFESLKEIELFTLDGNRTDYFAGTKYIMQELADEYKKLQKSRQEYERIHGPAPTNALPTAMMNDAASNVIANLAQPITTEAVTSTPVYPATTLLSVTESFTSTLFTAWQTATTAATTTVTAAATTLASTTTATTTFAPNSTTTESFRFPFVTNYADENSFYGNDSDVFDPTVNRSMTLPMMESGRAQAMGLIRESWQTENGSCISTNLVADSIALDSAPLLYPFVVEYSLICAAVIFIMWRHVGSLSRYVSDENIEEKLEIILSRKAVALARARNGGRVDCVGASKGLFFGLLTLVGSHICLILFFVLIHHPQFALFALYLYDMSQCVIVALSILAIFVGFARARKLKYYANDSTDLNDILLRISAVGMFIYSIFGVISGLDFSYIGESNLLTVAVGLFNIIQVVLQLLFIGDMSKRHVYLTEHDRTKPGRQIVTFVLICNLAMCVIFTFESQKTLANPTQLKHYGYVAWTIVQHLTLPLCIFFRFYSAIALAEIWKNAYKPPLLN